MKQIKRISIYLKEDNLKAVLWKKKIKRWILKNKKDVEIIEINESNELKNPEAIIILGGDGTIIEAIGKFSNINPIFMGLNLGNIGFMASVRDEKNFLRGMDSLLSGNFRIDERVKISAKIIRDGKKIAEYDALNEITIQHIFGVVEIEAKIEGYPFQYIRGNGMIVSTASGSTAYNMSAHGPIIMPELNCFILTEIMDHNLPTPSVVLKSKSRVTLLIEKFRKNNKFIFAKTTEDADVILVADGAKIIPLKEKDEVIITGSRKKVKFAEIEKNYFFKSLQEKFAFK